MQLVSYKHHKFYLVVDLCNNYFKRNIFNLNVKHHKKYIHALNKVKQITQFVQNRFRKQNSKLIASSAFSVLYQNGRGWNFNDFGFVMNSIRPTKT